MADSTSKNVVHSDYIGFTFNGVHSSELGIKRTSDGSRFNESLLPTSQDKTVQVPGGDGTYLFGSYFTQKPFNIPYAFDELTEEQLNRIKMVFGDKKIHELIFDETPYKVYQAKVTGNAQIKHIPFSEGATNRVYKGEGSIQFTAYEPYARCVHKFLDEEYYDSFDNIDEWNDAAKLLEEQDSFDKCIGNTINLYNPGVRETDFVMSFEFKDTEIPAGGISIGNDRILNFKTIVKQGNDDEVRINTKLNLIEGYENGRKSGKVYNRFITEGTFFKIPITMETEEDRVLKLVIDNANGLQNCNPTIEYNYIYF